MCDAFIKQCTQTFPFWRQDIQAVRFYYWPIVQDSGVPTAHDKPGSLTCPVYSTDTLEHLSWKEPHTISPF